MTKEDLKHIFLKNVMDLRNKDLLEQDSLLDVFEDVIEPYISELEQENARLTTNEKSLLAEQKIIVKENTELKEELKKWKDEWQEQVQKATDEGYARTLQTMQLTKAKEIIKTFLEIVNNDVEYVQNPQDCKDLWKELCENAEQFIKDSEVENVR